MMFIQIVAALFSLNAQALTQEPTLDNQLKAVQAALAGGRAFVTAIEQKDYASITQEQMSNAVQELAEDLIQRNDSAMAQELLSKWNKSQSKFYAGEKELGDHSTLFPWLEDFLSKMAARYGAIIYSLPYVQDIRTLNFAIPVVFAPRSAAWQVVGQDNRIEYRKHFIPFANIVTYYASYYGCMYFIKKNGLGQLKQLCGKAATQLKFVMGRYVAPVLSDWIFKGANRSELNYDLKDLTYTSADELLNAISVKE